MIEVRNTVPASQIVVVPASSKGTVDTQEAGGSKLPKSAENVPENTVKKAPEGPEKTEAKLETAVASINDYVQSIHRDLQFSVDEDLQQTVIKVVDGGSGELIRQIPEEVFLELARKLNEDGELRLVNALG
ncbi:flagellar protein FlaG [Teredinibacter haidensis]|uniref:flagellar protein FlaG n=1 Tax=Teredinibacter haidensis TaxID=2731755 RepID=UPI000948C45E|nr:flagellar protein FlaG [Teredinibacter haidensis]